MWPRRKILFPAKYFRRRFYLRRFTRIWLPWLVGVCVCVCVCVCVSGQHIRPKSSVLQPHSDPPISAWLNQFWHVSVTWKDFLLQCVFMQHDSTRQLLMQDWSLGVGAKRIASDPGFSLPAWPPACDIPFGSRSRFSGCPGNRPLLCFICHWSLAGRIWRLPSWASDRSPCTDQDHSFGCWPFNISSF